MGEITTEKVSKVTHQVSYLQGNYYYNLILSFKCNSSCIPSCISAQLCGLWISLNPNPNQSPQISYVWQHTVLSSVNIHSLVFPVGSPFSPLKTSNEQKYSIFNETIRDAPPFTPCYYFIPIFNTIGLDSLLSHFPLPAKDIFMYTCIHERILTLNMFFYGKQLPLLTYGANAG